MLVVDTLVIDCVIGNIHGLRDNSFDLFNNNVASGECAAAVITRAQTKALKKRTVELKADDTPIADTYISAITERRPSTRKIVRFSRH